MNTQQLRSLSFITLLLVASVTLFFVSCEKSGVSEEEYQTQYRREAQLINVYDNGIAPLNSLFIAETRQLEQTVVAFKNAPTIANLKASQDQWTAVLQVWKRAELYNLGDIEDSFIHFEINRWPSNTETIDGFINGNATINESFVTGNGSSSKGISAMEYLLFSGENDQATLESFTTAENANRRADYLVALSQNLIVKAEQLEQLWVDFKPTFTSALQSGLSGSQNQLANAMVTLSEQIVIKKLGTPLGEANGGEVEVQSLENYRSKNSLISIKENVIELEKVFTGSYKEQSIKSGFNDFLVNVGAVSISNDIEASFANVTSKLNAISGTLESELVNNSAGVLELQEALNELEVLIKVDMSNAIGATVTVNSNDGD